MNTYALESIDKGDANGFELSTSSSSLRDNHHLDSPWDSPFDHDLLNNGLSFFRGHSYGSAGTLHDDDVAPYDIPDLSLSYGPINPLGALSGMASVSYPHHNGVGQHNWNTNPELFPTNDESSSTALSQPLSLSQDDVSEQEFGHLLPFIRDELFDHSDGLSSLRNSPASFSITPAMSLSSAPTTVTYSDDISSERTKAGLEQPEACPDTVDPSSPSIDTTHDLLEAEPHPAITSFASLRHHLYRPRMQDTYHPLYRALYTLDRISPLSYNPESSSWDPSLIDKFTLENPLKKTKSRKRRKRMVEEADLTLDAEGRPRCLFQKKG
ncbi:hypothetical protein EW145_g5376 [Phellinidium pouzarii]|uniref:Uncharacterized protein n=1 Tax=Phellinidium pouzarii TaxID=167371 RepID=A0A4S4L4Z0_9AGAM|nr:hypothetical protein EW145_g5376 [Phellinidium pouzarii]